MRELIIKEGEAFLIGDDIEIVVLSVRDGHAELGIMAPHAMPVHKREDFDVHEKIKQFNLESVKSADLDKAQNLFY